MDTTFGEPSRTLAAVIFHSNAPSPTSPQEPRIVYTTRSAELFFGAIPRRNGTIEMEFISWNRNANRYDFGVIRNFGRPNATVELANRGACLTCHQHGGPLFSVFPWSNVTTVANLIQQIGVQDRRYTPLSELIRTSRLGEVSNESPEVVTFFQQHPELRWWHGVDLLRGATSDAKFVVESHLIRGALRAITASAMQARTTNAQRANLNQTLLRAHLLNEAWRLNHPSSDDEKRLAPQITGPRPSTAEERQLDRELAQDPANRPILFRDALGANHTLLPTDLELTSTPLHASHDAQARVVFNLPSAGRLTTMTDALFSREDHAAGGLLDVLYRRENVIGLSSVVENGRRIIRPRTDAERRFVTRTYERLLDTAPLRALAERPTLPTSSELAQATRAGLMALLNLPVPPPQPDHPQTNVLPAPIGQIGAENRPCMTCHLGFSERSRLRFTFDPVDPVAWTREIANATATAQDLPAQRTAVARRRWLRDFRDSVIERISSQDAADTMPPTNAPNERAAFSAQRRQSILVFLRGLNIPQ